MTQSGGAKNTFFSVTLYNFQNYDQATEIVQWWGGFRAGSVEPPKEKQIQIF